jgi:hypothetical protein
VDIPYGRLLNYPQGPVPIMLQSLLADRFKLKVYQDFIAGKGWPGV